MEAQESASPTAPGPTLQTTPVPEKGPAERKKYVDRQKAIEELEALRPGRLAVSLFNFDRQSIPAIPGLSTQFHADVKEPLFRVLKESFKKSDCKGIDLVLYTRGGGTRTPFGQ